MKLTTNKNKGQRFYSSLSFFYASAKIIMYVTNVLQNRSKLDYSRGGGCYNEGNYGGLSIYQNKVKFI